MPANMRPRRYFSFLPFSPFPLLFVSPPVYFSGRMHKTSKLLGFNSFSPFYAVLVLFVSFMAKKAATRDVSWLRWVFMFFPALPCRSASLLLRYICGTRFLSLVPLPPPRNATTPDFCSATLRRCRHSSLLLPRQASVLLGLA